MVFIASLEFYSLWFDLIRAQTHDLPIYRLNKYVKQNKRYINITKISDTLSQWFITLYFWLLYCVCFISLGKVICPNLFLSPNKCIMIDSQQFYCTTLQLYLFCGVIDGCIQVCGHFMYCKKKSLFLVPFSFYTQGIPTLRNFFKSFIRFLIV